MTCALAHVNFFLCDFATGNAIRQAGGRKTPTCFLCALYLVEAFDFRFLTFDYFTSAPCTV
jgi:hypothetical protein